MSWTTPTIIVTGSTISSSQWNSQVRDNLKFWVAPAIVTAAGDTVYSSNINTLTKLSIGTKYQVLRINAAGNNFEWATNPPGALIYSVGAAQTLAASADTVITFDTVDFNFSSMANLGSHNERLTVTTNASYLYYLTGHLQLSSGTTAYSDFGVLRIVRYNSSDVLQDIYGRRSADGSTTFGTAVLSGISVTAFSAGNNGDYFKLIYYNTGIALTTNSGNNTDSRLYASLSAIMIQT